MRHQLKVVFKPKRVGRPQKFGHEAVKGWGGKTSRYEHIG